MYCFCFIVIVVLAGANLALSSDTCTPEYRDRSQSTMCEQDSSSFKASESGVTDAQKKLIIDTHNNYRANVQPTGRDLTKAVWDDNLAALAQKWSQRCIGGHDPHDARWVAAFNEVPGQNAAWGHHGVNGEWDAIIAAWYDEVKDFAYGTGSTGGVVGHYTQVVQGAVSKIGCGFSVCDDSWKKYYICNYMIQNADQKKPYELGPRCDACPSTCDGNGLCDCGGKYCFNGGKMDLNTCTCTCDSEGIFVGDECTVKMCPAADPDECGTWGHCGWTNIVAMCPHWCGVCKAGDATSAPGGVKTTAAPGQTTTSSGQTTAGTGTGNCENNHESCEHWARYGECDKNPSYMHKQCKRACGLCPGQTMPPETCEDYYDTTNDTPQCQGWADYGECEKNPGFMLVECKKACGQC